MSAAPTPLHARRAPRRALLIAAIAGAAVAVGVLLLLQHAAGPRSSGSDALQGSGRAAIQTRDLPRFNGIELAGSNIVTVAVGRKQSVVVHADDNLLRRVATNVESGRLVIGNATPSFTTKTPMRVEVNVPSIDDLRLTGSGVVVVNGVKARRLTVTLSGSGVVHMRGSATRLDVSIPGSGDGQLEQLVAGDVHTVVSGSGRILVTATNSLHASISGNGAIVYGGNPPHVTTSVTGAGAITRK